MTEDRKQKQVLFIISAVLIAATLVAYEPVRHNDFVRYDDHVFITENPNVTGGITQQSVIRAFTKTHEAYWCPLTWLSFMLNYEIHGLNPLGYHVTNLLIHITSSLLLFFLLSKMTGAIWRSAFVAAAFALHPIHVESVAWATERKDMLSGLFWMLTMLAYIHYVKQPGIKKYSLVLLAFAMGLMSKPMVVTLPFVLLLLDWWPLDRLSIADSQLPNEKQKTKIDKRKFFSLLYEKIPLFALSAVSCVITLITQKQGGAMVSLKHWPFYIRVINALGSYFDYTVKILYPKGLAALYPAPETMSIDSPAMAVMGILLLLVLWGRGRRWLVVGLLWYLGTLFPTIGLVQSGVQMMADRFTYLPSIGVSIIIAWGAAEIFSKLSHPKPVAAAAAAAALIAMLIMTRIQVGYWRDTPTLYKRAIAVTKNNYVMLDNLGLYLFKQGNYDEGLRYFKEAIRANPNYTPSPHNICAMLLVQNKLDEAISCFTEILQNVKDWPEKYKIYGGLGIAYEQKGDLALAETNYRKALELSPDFPPATEGLASVLAKQGETPEPQKAGTGPQQN